MHQPTHTSTVSLRSMVVIGNTAVQNLPHPESGPPIYLEFRNQLSRGSMLTVVGVGGNKRAARAHKHLVTCKEWSRMTDGGARINSADGNFALSTP